MPGQIITCVRCRERKDFSEFHLHERHLLCEPCRAKVFPGLDMDRIYRVRPDQVKS